MNQPLQRMNQAKTNPTRKASPVQLIAGLANPGAEYAETRHNAGAWFVQTLLSGNHQHLSLETKLKAQLARISLCEQDVWVMVPATYMNHSGQALRLVSQFYKIPVEAILVVHDELDLPPGVARLKSDGGHGGHNGLRDIMQQLGHRHFQRLRLGIGHPGRAHDVVNYVLKKPVAADRDAIDTAITQALHVMPEVVKGELEKAMKILHTN